MCSAAWEESHPPGCNLWAQMPKWLTIAEVLNCKQTRHLADGCQDLLWSDPVDPSIDQTANDYEATPNYFRGAGIRYDLFTSVLLSAVLFGTMLHLQKGCAE